MAASARVAYKLEAAEIIAIFWLLFAGFGFGFSSRFSYFFILFSIFSSFCQTLRKRSKLQRLQLRLPLARGGGLSWPSAVVPCSIFLATCTGEKT